MIRVNGNREGRPGQEARSRHRHRHSPLNSTDDLELQPTRTSSSELNMLRFQPVELQPVGLHSVLLLLSKNLGSWVYQLMIQFMVVSSFFLQDLISYVPTLAVPTLARGTSKTLSPPCAGRSRNGKLYLLETLCFGPKRPQRRTKS